MSAAKLTTSFTQTFQDAYLRNNRRGGQKNLRCFPEHTEKGHQCNGFCGRAVVVECGDCSTETQLHSLAEFVTVGKEPTDIAVGRSFPTDTFDADTRCKKDPLRRFVRGIKEGNQFSYKPSCWHYSWRSNKHATDTKHFLRVVTFQVTGATMTCVSTVDTTKFTLFSSKILDKTTSKRRAPVVKQNKSRPKKKARKVQRSMTMVQAPHSTTEDDDMSLSNVPTEEMDAWGQYHCPPSPVSVALFDVLQESDEAFGLTLDCMLQQMESNTTKHEYEMNVQSRSTSPHLRPTPTIKEFVVTSSVFDHNSLFQFDPFLLETIA